MIELKACERCLGDMLVEDYLGDRELVCIQCGNRQPLPTLKELAAAAR